MNELGSMETNDAGEPLTPSEKVTSGPDVSKPERPERLSRRIQRGDSYFLLFLLLLVTFAMSIISTQSPWSRIANAVLTGLTLVAAIRISHAPRRQVLLGWIGLATVVAAGILGEVLQQRVLSAFVSALATVLLLFSIVVILRRLAHSPEVTFETVAGALCVYVIFGLAFASTLYTLSLFANSEFLVAGLDSHGPITRGDYSYFSFLTVSTLGYGDIVAANPVGRALATLEAVLGQVYLVTTVAWLVSVARPRRPRKGDAA